MTSEEFKSKIQEALQSFLKGNLTKNSLNLFEKLGYVTERRAPLFKPTFAEFKDTYIIDHKFDEAKARAKEWVYVDLLFQLSKEEVSRQANLFDTKQVDKTIIETYLFFIIELNGDEYNRTDLSSVTREINRLFPMPVMVLFKYGNKLTFSVINRRLNKRDDSKDVLEKVTLIKDISIESPLRAHIEILFDLSFSELLSKHQFSNFVDLHNAWQKTLDTKELNKRFYSELFNWYLWAVPLVRFPNDVSDEKDNDVYNSESVIRLLTRLIFVWFIKEKNLVPQSLFNIKKLKSILNDFQPQSERTSTFYRAILQNLFFATLNTPMDKDITEDNKDEKRRFIKSQPKTGNEQYLDQTKYRYQDYFITSDKALELFATIPFLNGGLFECLDYKEGNKEIRFDGFSSTDKRQAFVSDNLFFAEEFILDLNAEYGTKGKKYKVKGLINILDSYKFTITENTPLEEEIALDPELLGKVFENLLASYNPETQTTARKQTGSFYTPREIVNYMVDESLIAYFKEKLDKRDDVEIRLKELFDHTINLPEFTKAENAALIKAISEVKVLDPACGSGAFPMGVLHRLVDLLNKLDPDNRYWNELQKQRAIAETAEVFNSGDTEERKVRLNEINKAFDLSMNYPDYARKLFLIENCIYGVDIQQIAIQISKLRFFISLIVDQKVNDNKPNRNILSMPNLETKFVAANTLIALDKPQQMTLMAGDVERLEKELASIRHKIFFTRKYSAKKALKKQEKEKREDLQTALTQSGYSRNVAGQIAGWNPFDPMQSAKFFDPETMFGFDFGFDVVIGNPPYVDAKKLKDISSYLRQNYETYSGSSDLFVYFYECGIKNLKVNGVLSFITSNKWIRSEYGRNLRKYFLEKNNPIYLIDFGTNRVFDATVDSSILLISKSKNLKNLKVCTFSEKFFDTENLKKYLLDNFIASPILNNESWLLSNNKNSDLKNKIERIGKPLKDFGHQIYRGVATGYNEAFFIDSQTKEYLIKKSKKNAQIIKPLIQGKNIHKYVGSDSNLYLIFIPWHFPLQADERIKGASDKAEKEFQKTYPDIYYHILQFKNQLLKRNKEETGKRYEWYAMQRCANTYYPEFEKEKILWQGVAKRIEFCYDDQGHFCDVTAFIMTGKNLKYFLAILNSKFFQFSLLNIYLEGDTFKSKNQILQNFPIPKISENLQKKFIKIVDQVLTIKKANPHANTLVFEKQLDEMVYKLYELTDEEIKIIEGNE
jgi:adenine-specific DNA-methyltransferase